MGLGDVDRRVVEGLVGVVELPVDLEDLVVLLLVGGANLLGLGGVEDLIVVANKAKTEFRFDRIPGVAVAKDLLRGILNSGVSSEVIVFVVES